MNTAAAATVSFGPGARVCLVTGEIVVVDGGRMTLDSTVSA